MLKWMAFVSMTISLMSFLLGYGAAQTAPLLDAKIIQDKLAEGVRESPLVQLGDTTWRYVGTPVVSVKGFHISISFNVEPVK
jgi:hypothetical protein